MLGPNTGYAPLSAQPFKTTPNGHGRDKIIIFTTVLIPFSMYT